MMDMDIAECRECGQVLVGSSERELGTLMAVHQHKEHPDTYKEYVYAYEQIVGDVEEVLD